MSVEETPVVELKGRSGMRAELEKIESTRQALFVVALMAAILLIFAVVSSNADTPQPGIFAVCMSGAVLGGIYVFSGLIEVTFGRSLVDLKSTLIFWAIFIACMAYLARTRALSDINAIFHADATLFPMTILASTILHSISLLFWPVILFGIVSAVLGITSSRKGQSPAQTVMISVCHAVNAFICLVVAVFVSYKIDDGKERAQMIYRIAHITDFSSYSLCKNIDSTKDDILFVDANRYLALTAPKINDTINVEVRKVSVFRSIAIPDTFPVVRCVY